MVPKRKRIPRRGKDKVPSFSARIYRENEGSRSRRVGREEGREGVVRVSVAIYPWGGIYLSSTRSSSVVTRPFAAPLPSLAPRNYVRNERKAPPGRGRGPFRRERRPVLLYATWTLPPDRSQTTFYPEPAAKDRPPRFSALSQEGVGSEDPEKSRVYNSRLNFCPCF